MIDDWIAKKIGLGKGEALSREAIEGWQLERLREVLAYAAGGSPWYAKVLSGIDPERDISRIGDIAGLPFMSETDIRSDGASMVCAPASGVSRIVTLDTSGASGPPKRIYFTERDQELMIDYVHNGLKVMIEEGDVFLILMPCDKPGSVGDLVGRGVERIGARTISFGPPPADGSRDRELRGLIEREGVTSLIATAKAAARLAGGGPIGGKLRAVLLSADFVSPEARDIIEGNWGVSVFEHYGMTEMGLGGAMACEARLGYHPREADLLFEIIDPDTGRATGEGERGEIVFTTLTREAMPLIRFRTGDFSRWLPGRCPCGSVLKRIGRVEDRGVYKAY